ncbi:MAG: hypothetical protein J5915_06300 [Acidaminococcaceae bacterium]|nr:hypothetical protein [Acidaminococcaceae bacterium]
MKQTDITIQNISLIQNMVGAKFEKFKCDSFIFSPTVFGIIGLYVDGKVFKLTSLLKPAERFYSEEEVAQFKIESATEAEIKTMMDEGEMIENPVNDTIRSIIVINDNETINHAAEQRTFSSTKGIIFQLSSGNEISFEIGTWFSEFITVRRGYNLIEHITSTKEFLEEWEDSPDYRPSVERSIITLK